ncbi:uncharacterized protein LOC119729631 [Patiria miniata]|uniref:CCHC-type domain-containing protein n=1 Tax=Patiria miniata TaxID=46514 RepID=A0A913Z0K5_PATMI|nr:uncharacterized protein LOC119720012 [Patiria miniata]XP_038058208.1 uncharacterized protein LOC119729631 [Patiria miniata]
MDITYDIVEEKPDAYEGVETQASPAFKGLCVAFKISAKYFEDMIKDGWEDVDQLLGLDRAWSDHILALAPNGGQRRNFERLMARVEAGPLAEQAVGRLSKQQKRQQQGEQNKAADALPAKDAGAATCPGPSDATDDAVDQKTTPSPVPQAKSAFEVHKPRRLELLKACAETGYDRNVAYVMSLLRKYVDEFAPLSSDDIKEKQMYVNLLTECTKHVEAKVQGIAMYIYKSITGEDSDKRLRFARKHLGLAAPPADNKARVGPQGGVARPWRQSFRPRWNPQQGQRGWGFRSSLGAAKQAGACFRCQKRGHMARDCKEIL